MRAIRIPEPRISARAKGANPMKTVQTVCGPVSASELGHFQMHEHLFVAEGPGTHRFPALLADDCERSAQ